MVRHDTTFELVSGYQVSWVIRRHRTTQTASISPFFIPNERYTFLMIIGVVIEAFEDACSCFDANGQQPWVDLYRKKRGDDMIQTRPHTGKGKDKDEGDNSPPKKKAKTSNSISAVASTSADHRHPGDMVCRIFSQPFVMPRSAEIFV